MPLDRVVAQTPQSRDRFVDVVRAASLLVVVAGHFVMGIVWWAEDGVPRVGNMLAAYAWGPWLTWAFQVLPLFFFAGGVVNAGSWAGRGRSSGYPRWIWSRAARLMKPVSVYLAVACSVAVIVTLTVTPEVAEPLMLLLTQLLWFVGVYVAVTALTPLLWRAQLAHPVRAVVGLVAAVALIDAVQAAAPGLGAVGVAAFVVGWAVPHQLGFWYRTWVPGQQRRRVLAIGAAVVAAGVAANLALTVGTGWFPTSMVGLPGEPRSNIAPPSLVLVVHSVVLCVLAVMVAPGIARWAQRPRVWRAAVAVNLSAMTLYLWHLPVLTALLVASHAVGLTRAVRPLEGILVPADWSYLPASLVLAVAYAAAVFAVVRALWWVENARWPWWDDPATARDGKESRGTGGVAADTAQRVAPSRTGFVVRAAAGVGLVGAGFLALSGIGLGGFPARTIWFADAIPINAAGALVAVATGVLVMRSAALASGDNG